MWTRSDVMYRCTSFPCRAAFMRQPVKHVRVPPASRVWSRACALALAYETS
jgi:hypothetical protein